MSTTKKKSKSKIPKREKIKQLNKLKEDYNLLINSLEYLNISYSSKRDSLTDNLVGFSDYRLKLAIEILQYYILNYDIEKYTIYLNQFNKYVFLEISDSNNLIIKKYSNTIKDGIKELTMFYDTYKDKHGRQWYISDIRNLSYHEDTTTELLSIVIDAIKENPELYYYKDAEFKKEKLKRYFFKKSDIFNIVDRIESKHYNRYSHLFTKRGFTYTNQKDIILTIQDEPNI